MVRLLCLIAYLGLMISIEPHFEHNSNVITAFARAFLEVAKLFCFYFLCRMVSVQARYRTSSWMFWYVFEKFILPVAILYSLQKFLEPTQTALIILTVSMLVLIDPMDTIGKAMRASLVLSEGKQNKGVASGEGTSAINYVPALILAAALYLVIL